MSRLEPLPPLPPINRGALSSAGVTGRPFPTDNPKFGGGGGGGLAAGSDSLVAAAAAASAARGEDALSAMGEVRSLII